MIAGDLIAQYRVFAEECGRLLVEAKEPRHKQLLQEMAQAWTKLADEEDGKKTA